MEVRGHDTEAARGIQRLERGRQQRGPVVGLRALAHLVHQDERAGGGHGQEGGKLHGLHLRGGGGGMWRGRRQSRGEQGEGDGEEGEEACRTLRSGQELLQIQKGHRI